MCKLYQIEYTCRHLAKIETAYCCIPPPSNCPRGISIFPQIAPHKCPPCRTYDRDRWRRGWPRIPLPPPPPKHLPRDRKVPEEPDSDDEFAVDFEEGTAIFLGMGRVEHDEEGGGVGLGNRKGFGGEVRMSGGLNGEDTGSSEGFGLGIDGAGAGAGGSSDQDKPTTARSSPDESATKTDRGLRSKKRAESFVAGDGDGDAVRSRFGGFGGRKLRSRRASMVDEVGGVPMERTVSNRGTGFLSLRSPGGASYRGADMERGGGGGRFGLGLGTGDIGGGVAVEESEEGQGGNLGLGLGFGMGFGGVSMEIGDGRITVQGVATKRSLSASRRSNNMSKVGSVSIKELDGTSDETQESITAQFLDF